MTRPVSSDDIRETFLRFFTARQHLRIAAASVIPAGDPTLLYVNAGMAPLKPYFTGEAIPPAPDLCNIQPCVRTIDIEDVGDRHHLTFFEMLGSWSVDHYGRERAVELAWDLLTSGFGFAPGQLYVTVYAGDSRRPVRSVHRGVLRHGTGERARVPAGRRVRHRGPVHRDLERGRIHRVPAAGV